MNKNHIGEIVGIYTITGQALKKDTDGHALYKGICNICGFERIARYHDLKMSTECSHTRIDGKVAFNRTGWNNRRIQEIFYGMRQRCYNKNNKNYKWYGAKGIKICDNWMDNPTLFEEWALQNGYQDNLTIDRIDEKKDYAPDNCRWITDVQNTKYKSTTSLICVDEEKHTGREWSKILGFGINTINKYIKKYGKENTVEFIRRYKTNPNLWLNSKGKNIYNIYMTNN